MFVASGGRPAAARSCCGTCLRSNSCCATAAPAAVPRDPGLTCLHLALHSAVPVILDGVVGPAWQILSNFCPLIAKLCVLLHQGVILVVCPVTTFDVWIKVVVPSAVQRVMTKAALQACVLCTASLT